MTRVAVASVVMLALAAPARADDALDRGRAAVKASDYPGARAELAAALAAGHATHGELAELYELSGIVEAALGNSKGATTAFVHWLVLETNAMLPPGTSPKIVRPFDAARTQAAKLAPLAINVETTFDPPQVAIAIAGDPLHMIARVRVYVAVNDAPEHILEDELTDGRVAIALPRGNRLTLHVAVLDEHGNHVVEQGSQEAPLVLAAPEAPAPPKVVAPHPPPPPPRGAPMYRQAWLWTAVGAVALAGGGSAFGFAAQSAASELRQLNANSAAHYFTEAQAVQSRGDRDALLCNVGFIAAGSAALAASVLYLIENHHSHRREVRVAGAVTATGAALTIGGGW